MTEAEVIEGARVRVECDVVLVDGSLLGPGEVGRVVRVFPGDDTIAFVELDRYPGSRVKFIGRDEFLDMVAP